MSSDDWARKIFSEVELEELSLTSEKIVYDSEHGLIVNIGLSNDMCVDLVEAWGMSQSGHLPSQMHMLAFIEGFIDYLRNYLNEEDIPFDDGD
jgi:hypothetical protein